ncbi:hypothetical protein GCM10009304_10460 [Pseudomonas matsuisoli]|uniref:Uncharacterized protein n=2 Tax=Pseudomonas matsuisoli TaxID=1515666 RepID=A0A917UUJ2_9PSED|nr:hypothetical protein GCM10009304_10460 [Pseudomonas matsuisoli]
MRDRRSTGWLDCALKNSVALPKICMTRSTLSFCESGYFDTHVGKGSDAFPGVSSKEIRSRLVVEPIDSRRSNYINEDVAIIETFASLSKISAVTFA